MLPEKRRADIVEDLNSSGSITVSKLSDKFNVTEETIRKDLEKLDNQGLIKRIHGGAVPVKSNFNELSFNIRKEKNIKEKNKIAEKAVELIEENSILFLDASTTCLFLAKKISSIKGLTVITNSIRIMFELSKNNNVSVISTGGYLRSKSLSLVGSLANETVKKYNVNYFFASCSGLSIKAGATETNEFETEVKISMVEQSEKTIILADHSKIDKSSLTTFAKIDQIDMIITDDILENKMKNILQEMNIKIK